MLGGDVAMVGVICAKSLKRPSRSDLSNSYGSDSGVLLANKYANQDPIGWWMSEKLDGVRAIWDGNNLKSRNGNIFHTPKWFKDELPKNVKLDGELFVGRGQFPETISIVKSHEDKGWSKIKYRVFDLPSDKRKFEDRQKTLRSIVSKTKSRHLKYVKQTKCKSLAQFNKTVKDLVKLGAEGTMLREPGSLYEPRRSSTLLKVKKFHDAEAKVVGHEKGTGRLSGVMGALICERNGKRFKVGSGFTDAQRRKPPKIGSKITFRYQEMTERGVPRFPTFVAIRDYEGKYDKSEKSKETITGYPVGTDFGYYVKRIAKELEKLVRKNCHDIDDAGISVIVSKSLMRCSEHLKDFFEYDLNETDAAEYVHNRCSDIVIRDVYGSR